MKYIAPLGIFAYAEDEVSVCVNVAKHFLSYTKVAKVSVCIILWGLIMVQRAGKVGVVSLFGGSVSILRWEPMRG